MDSTYTTKAKTVQISATSRVALKLKDNFYTVEYHEERAVPTDIDNVNLELERAALWDDVNKCVDAQAAEIIKSFK